MTLTPTQTAALHTVLDMAASYLEDLTTGLEEGIYDHGAEEVPAMETAIAEIESLLAAHKLIGGIESGEIKLVNQQE